MYHCILHLEATLTCSSILKSNAKVIQTAYLLQTQTGRKQPLNPFQFALIKKIIVVSLTKTYVLLANVQLFRINVCISSFTILGQTYQQSAYLIEIWMQKGSHMLPNVFGVMPTI